jgi:ribosomal protein L37E
MSRPGYSGARLRGTAGSGARLLFEAQVDPDVELAAVCQSCGARAFTVRPGTHPFCAYPTRAPNPKLRILQSGCQLPRTKGRSGAERAGGEAETGTRVPAG